MTMIAAPVINVDDNFLVTNGWTEAEPFTNPNDRPETSVLDPKPIVMRWNRREYVIPPGETKQVPFDCIRVNFGDPRAINTEQRFPGPDGRVGLIPKREAELIRLSIFYGLYQQGMHLLPELPIIKHVKITTVPLGEDRPAQVIYTPANDPDGSQAIYGHPEVEPDRADIISLVENLERRDQIRERELADLRAQVYGSEVPPPQEEEIEKDVPTFG